MSTPSSGSGLKTILAVVAIIFGLVLLIGGIYLAVLGGSWYYIIAGLFFIATAVLLHKLKSSALLIYAALLLGTVVWGLWEVGSDFFALAPRLDILGLFGLLLLIPAVTRGFEHPKGAQLALAGTLVITIAVMIYSVFNDPQEIRGELSTKQPATSQPIPGVADGDWPAYGRTQSGLRYSPLKQINSENVKDLQVAWEYHTGEFKTENDSGETTNQVTPIKVGDNMYICTTHQKLTALDPATGQAKWTYDPKLRADNTYQHLTCRGVSYYDANNTAGFEASLAAKTTASADCSKKVILPVNDGRLVAINADTGKACTDFGKNGEVDLQKDMPFPYPGGYIPTSPPVVTGTTIIIGGSTTDNYLTEEPSGVIRGYDVNTGELLWVFDTGAEDPNAIPAPGQKFVHNSPNAWAPLAYDAKLDMVYVPTGVSTPDIYGGHRTELDERYANSMLALNASTGKLVWNFQTTHHDLWDMDVPAQPTLADIKDKSGNLVPAIYVLTKTGNAFVLDRRTGKAIVPITERPVPQTVKRCAQTKGERYSPTQPFSYFDLAPK